MNWPLMQENITREDVREVVEYLGCQCPELHMPELTVPRLTQGEQVTAFEREFADWLGVKYAVMVNSGASANLITMAALQYQKPAEIIVPTITWVSDIAAVLHSGYQPVFVDIDPCTLGMDQEQIFKKITSYTRAVFVTHTLGFSALSWDTMNRLHALGIDIIEDCCEATGATKAGVSNQKLGTFGRVSNFSFYYAHHLSTIEGGMVCTDDQHLYDRLRMFRSHGLVRESPFAWTREDAAQARPDLDPEFIFQYAAYNVRSTEINAVIGRSQLKRLDANNARRTENLQTWLSHLDQNKYFTDYRVDGSCNYALPLVVKHQNPLPVSIYSVAECLRGNGVEFRRGTAGGGNQLRQPYLRRLGIAKPEDFPNTEHVHSNGLYIGNYPSLRTEQIIELCEKLNAL